MKTPLRSMSVNKSCASPELTYEHSKHHLPPSFFVKNQQYFPDTRPMQWRFAWVCHHKRSFFRKTKPFPKDKHQKSFQSHIPFAVKTPGLMLQTLVSSEQSHARSSIGSIRRHLAPDAGLGVAQGVLTPDTGVATPATTKSADILVAES